jgi:hypothetical protein
LGLRPLVLLQAQAGYHFAAEEVALSSSANFPQRYTTSSAKQLGPTCCTMRSKPKIDDKFLLGFPTMKNMAMLAFNFLAVDLIV